MASRPILGIVPCLLFASTLAVRAPAQATPELPSSKEEVSNALAHLRDRYGLDAVKLESFLLQYAIEAGAVLTTSVGMRGVEKVGEHSYLQVDFDTGIIYAPSDVSRSQAPARIWSEIVAPTLRQFESMQVAADGIVLHIRFRHSEDDAMQILRERRQDSIPIDVVSFRMLCRDVVEAVRSAATSAQLLERAVVLLNGDQTTLALDEAAALRRLDGAVTPPLPLE
jgi:hypothetical protein